MDSGEVDVASGDVSVASRMVDARTSGGGLRLLFGVCEGVIACGVEVGGVGATVGGTMGVRAGGMGICVDGRGWEGGGKT